MGKKILTFFITLFVIISIAITIFAIKYQGAIEYQYKLRVFHTTIPDVNARAFLLSQRNHCIKDVATTKFLQIITQTHSFS